MCYNWVKNLSRPTFVGPPNRTVMCITIAFIHTYIDTSIQIYIHTRVSPINACVFDECMHLCLCWMNECCVSVMCVYVTLHCKHLKRTQHMSPWMYIHSMMNIEWVTQTHAMHANQASSTYVYVSWIRSMRVYVCSEWGVLMDQWWMKRVTLWMCW